MKIRDFLILASVASMMAACGPKDSQPPKEEPKPIVDPVSPEHSQPAPAASEGAKETMTGTYVTTEQGDYFHAIVKGDDGTEYSYFFAPDLPEARSDELIAGMYDGKKVQVTWRKAERDIPEAGGRMEVDEIVDIEPM